MARRLEEQTTRPAPGQASPGEPYSQLTTRLGESQPEPGPVVEAAQSRKSSTGNVLTTEAGLRPALCMVATELAILPISPTR